MKNFPRKVEWRENFWNKYQTVKLLSAWEGRGTNLGSGYIWPTWDYGGLALLCNHWTSTWKRVEAQLEVILKSEIPSLMPEKVFWFGYIHCISIVPQSTVNIWGCGQWGGTGIEGRTEHNYNRNQMSQDWLSCLSVLWEQSWLITWNDLSKAALQALKAWETLPIMTPDSTHTLQKATPQTCPGK